MATAVTGVVKQGLIVPSSPLPEGAMVEVRLLDASTEIPAELQEELVAWQQASADALALVERLAQEAEKDEAR